MNRPLSSSTALPQVDRAAGELRRGGMVALSRNGQTVALMLAAEYLGDDTLAALAKAGAGAPMLAMSARRAEALGFGDGFELAIVGRDKAGAAEFAQLADPMMDAAPHGDWRKLPLPDWAAAAVGLAKLAGLLPAALVIACDNAGDDILEVCAEAVLAFPRTAARSLKRVAEADLPLAASEQCHVVAFRPADGGAEHLALIVGQPDLKQPVLTRLHSACFTGDLLGSLRCDCGEQLQGAIARLAKEGGGVLLYLAQEGRGIGLVNKLRAYQLQDGGLDTLDANRHLGFEDDERLYLPAVQILSALEIGAVRLLTNNPHKVEALTKHGVTVTERVPHVFPANPHNRRYLATKAARSGHLF
jgi:GTP cyclohydrolase II